MRWKGLIFLAVVIALGVVLSLFYLDKWVESGLEKAGSALVGAKVEIDNLDLDVAGLSIEWQRLQVTDPNRTMQNVIETGRTAFKMELAALLRKKTVIREMTLADVRTGTPRETDGAIPNKPEKEKKKSDKPDLFDKTKSKLTAEIQNLPVNPDIMFADHKDVYKQRVERRQRKLLEKIQFIRPFLHENETILCVSTGCSPVSLIEQFLTGWIVFYLKRSLFVFTNERIFHIPTKHDFSYRNSIAQILYTDCASIAIKGRNLVVEYKNGKKESLNNS